GRMRPKIPDLQRALVGYFTDHHARLCRKMLDHIDSLTATITELTGEIDAAIAPFHRARRRLSSIPGVSERVAEVIIAETGGDMSRFATPQRLASWAGMCPGNNESADKHFSGRIRKGNRGLRGALGEAAAAASRSKNTYLSARYRRLSARRGKKRAMVAVGHDILLARGSSSPVTRATRTWATSCCPPDQSRPQVLATMSSLVNDQQLIEPRTRAAPS
ncbi:MAG: transposase, partial [Actinomycetota bacterium]|nr:transposase [Actinomycetota bacterium]